MIRKIFVAGLFFLLASMPNAAGMNLPIPAQDHFPQNKLVNPGFENGTYGWTASGGATKTANSTAKGEGSFGYDWDSNSAGQTLVSTSYTIESSLIGKSGLAYCGVKTPSGTATHTISVNDGTNDIGQGPQTIITSSSNHATTPVSFIFPSSGTLKIKMTSVNANEPEIYVDSCYIGVAFNVTNGQFSTPWVAYTPALSAGFGTTTNVSFFYRRVQDSVQVQGFFTAGTVAASIGSISLPTGLSLDTTKILPNNTTGAAGLQVGDFTSDGAASRQGAIVTATATSTSLVYYAANYSNTTDLAPNNVSSNIVNNSNNSVRFTVPIASFTDQGYYTPAQTPASWSGYSAAISGGCSTASASYADPSACTNIAVTQTTSRNIVCTQSSTGPAISCTLPRIGMYEISADAVTTTTGAGTGTNSVRLVDGSGALIDPGRSVQLPSAGPTFSLPLKGIYNVTSLASPAIFKLQLATTAATSGQFTQGTAAGSAAIQWVVKELDAPMPAPFLTGSVTCNSLTSQCRTEYAAFGGNASLSSACTAGTCTLPSASGGVTNVTFNATGKYNINFAAGTFSAAPNCTCSCANISAVDIPVFANYSSWTSTLAIVQCVSAAGASTNDSMMCTCIGPR